MFQSPLDKVFVTVESKYVGHISNILKVAQLNPANQLDPADLVQIVGTVVSIPKAISNEKRGYEGYSTKDIQVGDKCIFSYRVIYDYVINPETDTLEYKNMVWYKGKEYFAVDIQNLFAVIRNDSIKMINGFCMIEEVSEESTIVIPQHMRRIAKSKEAILTQIGNNLEGEKRIEAFPGDTIYCHPFKIQRYKINQKKFGIVRQKDIFGRMV